MNTTQPMLRIVHDDEDDQMMTTRLPRLSIVPAPAPEPVPAPAPMPAPAAAAPEASGIPAEDVRPGRSIAGRIFALVLLVATLAGLTWLGQQIYFVVTDGWVAPLHLSPQNDQIQSLRLTHQRYLDELANADAEVSRLDTELLAIDASIIKLAGLRGTSAETMKWQAEQNRVAATGLSSEKHLLRQQRDQIRALHAR
jgi:hypothetical protein